MELLDYLHWPIAHERRQWHIQVGEEVCRWRLPSIQYYENNIKGLK